MNSLFYCLLSSIILVVTPLDNSNSLQFEHENHPSIQETLRDVSPSKPCKYNEKETRQSNEGSCSKTNIPFNVNGVFPSLTATGKFNLF